MFDLDQDVFAILSFFHVNTVASVDLTEAREKASGISYSTGPTQATKQEDPLYRLKLVSDVCLSSEEYRI